MLALRPRQLHLTRIQSSVRHVPQTVVRFKPTAVDGPAVATDNSVVLNFNGKEEKIRLINNQIQISAVKDAFNLRTVQLNGLTEPVDQLGYTVAEFSPGTVITVSGAPTTEMEKLQAEIGALRSELQSLHDIRSDLRNVASLSASFSSMTGSYDDMMRRLMAPGTSPDDIAIIKKLLAGIVMSSRDSPDFTKTSHDGYTFNTFWEGRMLARDIINKNAESEGPHEQQHGLDEDMSEEEVMSSFHAT